MYKPGLLIWVMLLTFPWVASQADIFKTVDKDGNVVFTDDPEGKEAEPVKLKPSTIYSPPTIVPPDSSATSDASEDSFTYRSLTIKKPASGTTIAPNGSITVLTALSPRLRSADKLQLYLDGKPHSGKQRGLRFKVSNLARGPHTLDVKVLNRGGKVLNSASVTVYAHRPSGIKNSAQPSNNPSLAPRAPTSSAPTAPRAPNAPTVPATAP